jgi:hypothetical protein
MATPTHPLPIGSRVHHRGSIYNRYATGGGWGWATVREIVAQHDHTFEYHVERDEPLMPDSTNLMTWWASYHIDRVLPAVAVA